jgi:hypothetical protein
MRMLLEQRAIAVCVLEIFRPSMCDVWLENIFTIYKSFVFFYANAEHSFLYMPQSRVHWIYASDY